MTHFNPETSFNMRALFLLEAAGIPVMRTLSDYTQQIKKEVHIHVFPPDLNSLLETWLGYPAAGSIPPTWRNLLQTIRLLDLDELAQRMETYLSGAMEEHSPVSEIEGEEIVLQFLSSL